MVLDPVLYAFEAKGVVARWSVRRLLLTEQLSAPYVAHVELHGSGFDADPEELLGLSCAVTLSRLRGVERRVCGVIRRVLRVGTSEDELVVRVEIVPALWCLGQTLDSRIFQEVTAIEVVQQVLGLGLAPYKRTMRCDLRRSTYAVREYCVQYRESDLAFVERLLAEEGVGYYFEHDDEHERLVLVDANASYPPCAEPGTRGVRLVAPGTAGNEEVVHSFCPDRALRPTSTILREYEWPTPQMLAHFEQHATDAGPCQRILYEAAPALCLNFSGNDGKARAPIVNEREAQGSRGATGEGNVLAFAPGRVMELYDHGSVGLEGKYLIVGVTHEGTAPRAHAKPVEDDEVEYHHKFSCIPADFPYRPAERVPRPVVSTATATVVGPSGEEIYTDEHGRIKVQFHWDRLGVRDEHSSCWMRVMQTWSGAGFGTWFVPRIGMEVVVQFLEGNIDRPLVIGCVYNGANPTSMVLPDEKTKSGITTRSSPGGRGYNELVFEDAADQEEISLHAQKDLRANVLNDRGATVGNNDTLKVGVNQSITVGSDRTLNVGADESTTIGANRTDAIGAKQTTTVGTDCDTSIGGKQTHNVAVDQSTTIGGKRACTVGGEDSLSIGGKQSITVGSIKTESVAALSLENVGGAKTLSIGGGYTVTVGALMATTVAGISTENVGFNKTVTAGHKLELVCGDSKITLAKDGTITICGKQLVKLEGNLIDLN